MSSVSARNRPDALRDLQPVVVADIRCVVGAGQERQRVFRIEDVDRQWMTPPDSLNETWLREVTSVVTHPTAGKTSSMAAGGESPLGSGRLSTMTSAGFWSDRNA